MTEIMRRRRAILQYNNSEIPIPQGYIQDGLIFFLDGKQKLTSSSWEDIVSGKKFNLYNCVLNQNGGAVFDGTTSYGEYSGVIYITRPYTIELACSGFLSGKSVILSQSNTGTVDFLCRVYTDNGVDNVRIIHSAASGFTHYAQKTCQLYSNAAYIRSEYMPSLYADKQLRSGTKQYDFMEHSTVEGRTTLGCLNNENYDFKYQGTIYALRIYNRQLTADEIFNNQAIDESRYNITLI